MISACVIGLRNNIGGGKRHFGALKNDEEGGNPPQTKRAGGGCVLCGTSVRPSGMTATGRLVWEGQGCGGKAV